LQRNGWWLGLLNFAGSCQASKISLPMTSKTAVKQESQETRNENILKNLPNSFGDNVYKSVRVINGFPC
jgi:hypothetical protein